MVDIYEVMRTIRDIDNDHKHPLNNPHDPQHRQALQSYNELAEYCFIELNRRGSCDYSTSQVAPPPPPLIETRPGFKPP